MIAHGRKLGEVTMEREANGTYTVTVWEAEPRAVAQKTTNIPTAAAADAIAKPWILALLG